MKHFLFEDYDSGEDFIVGAATLSEAVEEAKLYVADPIYVGELTGIESEASGLDEY